MRAPDWFVARVFAVNAVSPKRSFQVLTERPGRMCALLGDEAFWDQVGTAARLHDPSAAVVAYSPARSPRCSTSRACLRHSAASSE
jgi:protein gp37